MKLKSVLTGVPKACQRCAKVCQRCTMARATIKLSHCAVWYILQNFSGCNILIRAFINVSLAFIQQPTWPILFIFLTAFVGAIFRVILMNSRWKPVRFDDQTDKENTLSEGRIHMRHVRSLMGRQRFSLMTELLRSFNP